MLSAGNVLSAPHANQGRTRFEGWRRSALRRGTRPHVASTARAVSPSVERGKDDAQATDPTSGERATSNEMESGPEPLHARKALTCGPRAAPEYGARAVHYLPRGAGGGGAAIPPPNWKPILSNSAANAPTGIGAPGG